MPAKATAGVVVGPEGHCCEQSQCLSLCFTRVALGMHHLHRSLDHACFEAAQLAQQARRVAAKAQVGKRGEKRSARVAVQ
eukprot:4553637-Prymnesium_polylepis.1